MTRGERTVFAVIAYNFLIRVRLARGDIGNAQADTDRLLEFFSTSQDAQVVWMALEVSAFARLAAGDREACEHLVDRLVESIDWDSPVSSPNIALLAVVMHALGRGGELADLTAGVKTRTPWLEAALASAAGDFVGAADVYQRMGDRPDEAYARLKAAERLVEEGRGPEARDQLERALAFFRSVRATAYIEQAEALLPAPA
jgi:hypothetical protein